jgi:hypothetical protein
MRRTIGGALSSLTRVLKGPIDLHISIRLKVLQCKYDATLGVSASLLMSLAHLRPGKIVSLLPPCCLSFPIFSKAAIHSPCMHRSPSTPSPDDQRLCNSPGSSLAAHSITVCPHSTILQPLPCPLRIPPPLALTLIVTASCRAR